MLVPETDIAKYIVSCPRKHGYSHPCHYVPTNTCQVNHLSTDWQHIVSTATHQARVTFLSLFLKAEHWPHKRLSHFFSKHHTHLLISKELYSFIQAHSTVPSSFRSCLANRIQGGKKLHRALQEHNGAQLWGTIIFHRVFNSQLACESSIFFKSLHFFLSQWIFNNPLVALC